MYFADLHLHSRYSYACSKALRPLSMVREATTKGLQLIGTADCLHPGWRAELRSWLAVDDNTGLLVLQSQHDRGEQWQASQLPKVKLLPTAEVSTIWRQDGKLRKVHHLCLFSTLDSAEKLAAVLELRGTKLYADGRPTLALSAREFLALMKDSDPASLLIPAHIWTPWFALLGAKSGFDSIEECYGDLSGEISALETGLSSDPPMNWRCSRLDTCQLVSFSDAHSLENMGREATIFAGSPELNAVQRALRTGEGLIGTLEYPPQAGKYHVDGHRDCHIWQAGAPGPAAPSLCPSCAKSLTPGVLGRTLALADKGEGRRAPLAKAVTYILPLADLCKALARSGEKRYRGEKPRIALLNALGPELPLLAECPLGDLAAVGGEALAALISLLRQGKLAFLPGYDGQYGSLVLPTQ